MDQTWVRQLHITSDAVFAMSWRDRHKAVLSGFSCVEEFCAPRAYSTQTEVTATETGEHFIEVFYVGRYGAGAVIYYFLLFLPYKLSLLS